MCGRYTLSSEPSTLLEYFDPDMVLAQLQPRFNIAPTQNVPIIRATPQAARALSAVRWGLIPAWSKDPSIGNRLINARAETVADKPSFRTALRRRRCLVLADGFYEWRKQETVKQPYWIGLARREPFAFAGLWERWQPQAGEEAVESCTIITTDANAVVMPIHQRMPVILARQDYTRWLDPSLQDPAAVTALLRPYAPESMIAYPVSRAVNNPRNDDAALIEPLPGQ